MILVSMRVSCRYLTRTIRTLYFSIPDEGHYDLRAAWLRSCDLEAFNDVVRGFEHTTMFGTFLSYNRGKHLGTITVKQLAIHDTRIPPKYRVSFHLESGLDWEGTFECKIEDLVDRVREKFDNLLIQELQQAAQLLNESNFRATYDFTSSLKYAGVTIGTVTVKKDH